MNRRRIAALLSPDAGLRGLVVCLVLWVPLVSTILDFVFGGTLDVRRWVRSAAMADTITLLCFGGVILLRSGVEWIARRRGEPRERRARGRAIYFALSVLLMPFVLPVGFAVAGVVGRWVHRPYHPNADSSRIAIGFGVIIAALFFLQRARSDAREKAALAEKRISELENANLRAQLAALTAEMNPHMLFNALNTIASLVHRDANLAEETVVELAELYRGILKTSGHAMHSLAEELRICEAYLRIERARFGDRLAISVDVAPAVDLERIMVPVLLLQPLVENAIKHGIGPRARGGHVAIRVAPAEGRDKALLVTIEDDGVGFGRSNIAGNGRAIANCEKRLHLAYGGAGVFDVAARDEGGTRARLVIPNEAAA